jgi:diaminobutyrate-2-oxoglutarate transaminase
MGWNVDVIENLESEVRYYCRKFPVIFESAVDHIVKDTSGKSYIDFFTGAGALNYGHNNRRMKYEVLKYIENDGIIHSLDFSTTAKSRFMHDFNKIILQPRNYHYKIQFLGPTGTNAVEASLKLARLVTNRTNVIFFTNSFHGMTQGSLAVTASSWKRKGSGVKLANTYAAPFDGYYGNEFNTIAYLEKLLNDPNSGVDLPAAIIVETIQAEGGILSASYKWLRELAKLAENLGSKLIVDDIQVGCGRTGKFFSFEEAGIEPDMICLSKSISGYGFPMSLLLLKPEIDIWEPGLHNGTFRGNNVAFITGAVALQYWQDKSFEVEIMQKANAMHSILLNIITNISAFEPELKGRGLIQGITWKNPDVAGLVSKYAFENGLLLETCGANDNTIKLMPPLTISSDDLAQGMQILRHSILKVINNLGKV